MFFAASERSAIAVERAMAELRSGRPVLLTRGRDGMIVFVPPFVDLDATYGALVSAGCRILQRSVTGDVT